ncbi:uncharacterized protein LOC115411007 [Sphaeramia orbicularis]|uniref:uncharacterized protein LOC115411007 n=1 Tax=Sphaeramia orbicularis TaxID=375764 RepID=UPI00118121DF|nr:uncharacterized protein LOC115411007 [Sphaeramia orbicularis]
MYLHLMLFVFHFQTFFLQAKGTEEEDIRFFLNSALQCIESLQREQPDSFSEERLYRQLDDHTRTLCTYIAAVSGYDHLNSGVSSQLVSLYRCFWHLLQDHYARQSSTNGTPNNLRPPTTLSGYRGRPRYTISAEQIEHCMSIGMTWQRIASCFGISRRTLYRHRQILGVEPLQFSVLSNQELDTIVSDILHNTPNAGETYVMGSLRSRGLRVQRWRLRLSLHHVDPIGRSFRRRHAIHRRVYSVQAPNQLWHFDGNHKLVRWRMVFHGCVDGFSRTIIYLRCLSNNRASSVLSLFLEGIANFGLPLRVRCDHGMENIHVARFMLERRGLNSVITGVSVHNQRIERLWAELNRVVTRHFANIFSFMEEHGLLDSLNELHLFCLHYIYLPRIEQAVTEFMNQWNNHGLSTQGGQTPLQLWHTGVINNIGIHPAVNGIFDVDNYYGIDEEGPLPELQTNNNVIIPDIDVAINETTMNSIRVNPLENDGNHGINLFSSLINFLQ